MRAGLQLGLLGPFEVRLDGADAVSLGGLRQRALLAILALRANEVVSTDKLVDELWGERPPATAVHTVQVFVSRLRNALGPAGDRLLTRPPGYVLLVEFDEIDADRCERLYSDARIALAVGEASEARALLHDAVALWRGAPLADFTYEPFAQATIARLEELRISCREELLDAELALGRHAEVVSELEALVREHPFRERPRGQLMLALYRSGRQAEALEAFQRARRTLVEELAIEPSQALRELEQAILQHDESLLAPPVPLSGSPPAGAPEQERTPEPPQSAASFAASEPVQVAILRKSATVLVARIEASGQADPEPARMLVHSARAQAQRIIASHGGTFVAGLGGEMVAAFGVPVTNEDDAIRAVRAADELRSGLSALSAGGPVQLTVRVGLDTGEVVAQGTEDLFGEPLTGAIALGRAAQDAEVLLSDATRYLASAAIRVEPAERPGTWRLLAADGDSAVPARRHGTSLVDRESELAAALAAFTRAADTRTTHLLTVLGEAGVGKSRLVQELVDQLGDQATVLSGRCLSYGDGIALWPLREALVGAVGGESRSAIRGLLDDEEDADLVADVAAGALALGPAENPAEQVPWALRRILEVIARQRPVVVVIEDAHWAESPLLDLVDYLVDWLTSPALLVCLGRPELLESRPAWGGGHARVSSVLLLPLGEEDALRLLGEQPGGRQLSPEQRSRILETAEGNPLFVEQLSAMSAEDPRWSADTQIPATLQALLAARLDRLGPGERAFVERAAVIGRGFWPSAVVELLPMEARPSAAQHLGALVHRGLIHPEPSTVAGEEELRFHHILIRDVAYRSTPKALRGELHWRFADWLAARGDGVEEFVGYHLEQAFTYRAEIGGVDADARTLAARGGERLAVAGRRALARGDAKAAVKLLRRSVDLVDASGTRQPEVLLDLGVALSESGEFADAERVLEAALEQSREAQAEATGARVAIELSARRALVDPSARVSEMLAVAEQATAVFSRVGDEAGLSRAWQHVGEAHWIRCRCAEMERVLERALKHAEHAGAERDKSRILDALALATVFGPRQVDDAMRSCHAILERLGDDVRLTAVTEVRFAVLEAMKGRFDDARDRWHRNTQRLEDVGLGVDVASMQMYRAFLELMAGTPENAEPDVAAACAALERAGDRNRLATLAALLARLHYALGHYDDSRRYTAISEESASEDDVGSHILWRGTRGKALARTGEDRIAVELVESAVSLAGETDLLMLHGDALTDHAEVMRLLDQPAEARHDLEQAIEIYERKGIRVSADSARRSLRSLGSSAAGTGTARPA